MADIKVKINASSFGKKFEKMLDNQKFKESAWDIMDSKFQQAEDEFFTSFNQHPVTKEIEDGPNASNDSNTLGGYGNLFSFIGFESDTNPVEDLRGYLNESITMRQTIRRGNSWYFRITLPSMENIEHQTPMPWELGSSWVEGIEHGISNLSHYIYTHWDGSRSQEGLQVKGNYNSFEFNTSPYLTPMLEEFKNRFE
jgi:hypothetical protein